MQDEMQLQPNLIYEDNKSLIFHKMFILLMKMVPQYTFLDSERIHHPTGNFQ